MKISYIIIGIIFLGLFFWLLTLIPPKIWTLFLFGGGFVAFTVILVRKAMSDEVKF